ncbi:MAG: hypothetical protein M1817_000262 [Caeruleum heppii]|nr:MAG: hypothetical protein M1817_000262 [Caeruleum heppii]
MSQSTLTHLGPDNIAGDHIPTVPTHDYTTRSNNHLEIHKDHDHFDPEKRVSQLSRDDGTPSPPGEDEERRLSAVNSRTSSAVTTTTYPEGGLRAWSVVFGAWCGMIACFAQLNTIGTFQAYISRNQLRDFSESQIGWIFGVYVFLSFFCGVQIGPVFDKHGPRFLVLLGSCCTVASVLLLGICTQYWHFMLCWGVLGGLGTSLLFTPGIACIGHFFSKKRGAATGLAATGGSIGGIGFPIMLQALFPRVGFAWATRIMGFILLFLLIICNLLIRSRLPPVSGASSLPDFKIFRDAKFAWTTAGVFLVELGIFVPLSYITSYGITNGISEAYSYQLLAVLNAGSFFGRWVPGYVADYLGRFNTMILTVGLCIVSTFAFWLPAEKSVPLVTVFAVLFGFGSGSNISLTPVCVGQLCRTENYGRYYATSYTIVSFGTLVGIPIGGQIISASGGDYRNLIIFTGLCYVAGIICFIAARVIKVGWKVSAVY